MTIGSASRTGSQPTGGEAGGEIRNCLSGKGGRSVPSSEPSREEAVCNRGGGGQCRLTNGYVTGPTGKKVCVCECGGVA